MVLCDILGSHSGCLLGCIHAQYFRNRSQDVKTCVFKIFQNLFLSVNIYSWPTSIMHYYHPGKKKTLVLIHSPGFVNWERLQEA